MGRRLALQTVLACAAAFLLLALAFVRHDSDTGYSYFPVFSGSRFRVSSHGFRHSHIVVASRFRSHFDVYLAFVQTLQKVLGSKGHVSVYAEQPYRFGFAEIAEGLGLYDGTYHHPDNLINDVNSTALYPGEPDAMVDMVVFGTCEIDMRQWSEQLLDVYDARPAGKKFKLVCIVHNILDITWQVHITPWARRGAIRLLPISEHVAVAFRTKFSTLADGSDPGYEYIPVDVHVPILALSPSEKEATSAPLSNAVIQGSFQTVRRDYFAVFADLQQSLEGISDLDEFHTALTSMYSENPTAWGYKPLSDPSAVYETDPTTEQTPFILHLAGQGKIDVPHNLSNIVKIHTHLDYPAFYDLMHSMDVVIPAFAPRGGYYDAQASSTMAMAIECNAPILVSERIRDAYTYVSDDRVTVTRPQALREISAIKLLRTGVVPQPDLSDAALVQFEQGTQRMLDQGWRRSNKGFTEVKEQIWRANEDVSRRILNDIP